MRGANSTLGQISGLFYTYIHRRKDTGEVFYVGKGFGRRALQRSGRNDRWNKIVAKHGFSAEVVAPWPTEKEAFEHEVFLISTFRSMGVELANYSNGGEGASGITYSKEARARINAAVAAALARPEVQAYRLERLRAAVSTTEHRERTSKRMRVERNTEAARAKQSRDTASAWADPAGRARRLESMRAAAATPEARARLAEISRERAKDPAQVAAAAAHLGAMNAAKAKPVICLSTGQEFASCTEAAAALGLKKHGVKEVCLGYYSHTRGMKFKFKNQGAEATQPTE